MKPASTEPLNISRSRRGGEGGCNRERKCHILRIPPPLRFVLRLIIRLQKGGVFAGRCFGLSSDLSTCSSLVSPTSGLGMRLTCFKRLRIKSHRFFIFNQFHVTLLFRRQKLFFETFSETRVRHCWMGYTISSTLVCRTRLLQIRVDRNIIIN